MACSPEAEVLALLEAVYERVCVETRKEKSRPCRELRVVLNDMRMHGVEAISAEIRDLIHRGW